MILCEFGPDGQAVLFQEASELIVALRPEEVVPALARLDAARAAGKWVAGWMSYEAGYALEEVLLAQMPAERDGPLLVFGIYDGPVSAAGFAFPQEEVRLAPLHPEVSPEDYAGAFARTLDYIAAGDCYQINLTFPLTSRLEAGSALGLYGALAARQPVGYGAYADLGVGPVVVSRSPELFVRLDAAGAIEARPMKGTAPRDPDPEVDAALAAGLAASEKNRAENLMIVDLLRNDIARISKVGSVKVPELFAVDTFATLHQMSSRVVGQLAAPADLLGVMRALFPCGSITGAPKIRAMEIIREVEPFPRGVYCGTFGWMAPDGAAAFSVTIRTLSVWPDGRVVLNVGGGIVQDSTCASEWEEALWKARYVQDLVRPA
ncbi:aminodeoxychorismate synthase component I [Paracoccus aminophilus]|uniref:Para-aminobenzoate synthetase component I n=1 Tax=Paracoccus aminophilus JCM 7686 TaxID=1367847 RepID=S5Y7J8_PARAH|nr:aminodeoxychorismate synthase component I [Paracoccus aminophilus]AGT07318.1 para-aminobenzoate synthetase component I [Paracoccus aminophilus JCM 7686]